MPLYKQAIDGQWFKSQFDVAGLSMREVARRMAAMNPSKKIDASALSRTLAGERRMQLSEVFQIAHILNLPRDEVVRHVNALPPDASVAGSNSDGLSEMNPTPYESETKTHGKSPLFGSMKGTTIVMPGIDLTEPADPDWGRVYDDEYDPQQIAVDQVKTNIGLSLVGKIWALDELGLTPSEIVAALDVGHQQVQDAFAARVKARGW